MKSAALSKGSWHLHTVLDQSPGLRSLADTLADLCDEGHPIVACTADLKYSNGLFRFQERHPERFFQFGISEQNMVSAAAGIATTGQRPYVATFASFLALLCCEQIRTDVAFPGLPVRLIGHHSGFTLGFYGTSHHATEDIAIMRSLAGLAVVAPADGPSLAAALRATVDHPGPIYFRIARGRDPEIYGPDLDFRLGKAIVHSADPTSRSWPWARPCTHRSPRPRRCERRASRSVSSTCTRSSRSIARPCSLWLPRPACS
jgi:transketolase